MKLPQNSQGGLTLKRLNIKRLIKTSLAVFALCTISGYLAGQILKTNHQSSQAASTNITVTDNDQVITTERTGTEQTITRTSIVTVKDQESQYGYILSARISQNTISGATATISSENSTICPPAEPCTLSSTSSPILSTTNNNATTTNGDTTEWQVITTLPSTTTTGHYTLDIEYDQSPKIPPTMQTMSYDECTAERTTALDARNNQPYYVQRIGNLCWMESNLRYSGGGDNTYGDTKTLSAGTGDSYTSMLYYNPGGSTDYTNTAASGGFYGYLYTWCAAMGGQANACNNTSTSGFYTNISLCPAGWRLPTGGGSGTYPATDWGNLASALNASNDATGSANLRDNFLAVYSGYFASGDGGLNRQGSYAEYWSSTVVSGTNVYRLNIGSSGVMPGTQSSGKNVGIAIRCVKDPPPTTMQEMTTSYCASMPVYPTIWGELDLTDTRDNKVYKIRKLADNKCWMVDNLNLVPTSGGPIVIDSITSDKTSGTYNLDVANVATPSGTYCTNLSATTYPHKCGMHYNWAAATTGSALSSGTAPDSICPKNWRLPANGEHSTLSTALNWGTTNGANVINSYWRGLYAGYDGSTAVGASGYYWSATAGSTTGAYSLAFSSNEIYPSAYYYAKTSTRSVRCLAR